MSSISRVLVIPGLVASALLFIIVTAAPAGADEMLKAPEGAMVSFLSPKNGAKVKSPVTLKFEAMGIKTVPAGTVEAGTGHHHVIVDAPPAAEGEVVLSDAQHLHFGKAQTEATIELKPGPHTLTLQFADGIHRAYGPRLSSTIQIEVVP